MHAVNTKMFSANEKQSVSGQGRPWGGWAWGADRCTQRGLTQTSLQSPSRPTCPCVVVLSVELIPYSLHPTLPHPTLSQAKKVISGITVFDMAAALITKTRCFDKAEGLQLSPDDPTSPALI